MSSTPVATLYGDALAELNVVQPGESVPAAIGVLCLRRLNQLIDNWNAQRESIYTEVFATFTLVPAANPTTIGPSAQFNVTQRPVEITDARLILDTQTPSVLLPIDIITRQEYADISIPDMATSYPTCLYYEPDYASGKLFFWPVPTIAYDVRLSMSTNLAVVTDASILLMPQGYESAMMLTLAESLATPLGRTVPEQTKILAREARARIFGNNVVVPLLNLRDGQQQDDSNQFNYLSRSYNP